MAGKPDISGQFVSQQSQKGNYVYQKTTGELGVPGQVMTHSSPSDHKAVSRGTGGHASHQAGKQFGAPDKTGNLSLQNPNINSYTPKKYQGALGKGGSFRELEKYWGEKLQQGVKIRVEVEDVYRVGETRPFKRSAKWTETDPQTGRVQQGEQIFGNFSSPQERAATAATPPEPATEFRSETKTLLPEEPPPMTRYLNVPTANSPMGRLLGNQGAVAMLGQAIGSAEMWLNHRQVSKQVDRELNGQHAKTIQDAFAAGKGVLVVVRIQIFDPLPDAVPWETLLGVSVVPGASRDAALNEWRDVPKWLAAPPPGYEYSVSESYGWISPPSEIPPKR